MLAEEEVAVVEGCCVDGYDKLVRAWGWSGDGFEGEAIYLFRG